MSQPFIETDKGNFYLHERLRVMVRTLKSITPIKYVGELVLIDDVNNEIVLYDKRYDSGHHKKISVKDIVDITIIPKLLNSKEIRQLALEQAKDHIKDLSKQKRKEYYLKNKEKIKEYYKNYYHKNKDKIKKYSKKYSMSDKAIEYRRKYYQKNKDIISKTTKKYYQKHKPQILAYQKNYSLTHKTQNKEYHKNYYLKNKEKLTAQARAYYKKNKELKK